jgi:hypothetical protein
MTSTRPPAIPWPTGGRRLVGIAGVVLGPLFGIGFVCCLHYFLGFVPALVCAFGMVLCLSHAYFAFKRNLPQRTVRKIDYWYVGSAAVGLVLFAANYAKDRDATINRNVDLVVSFVGPTMLESIKKDLAILNSEACKASITDVSTLPCSKINDAQSKINISLSAPEIEAIESSISYPNIVKNTTVEENILAESKANGKDWRSHPFYLSAMTASDSLGAWKFFVSSNEARRPKSSPPNEFFEMMLGLGRYFLWPFILAFALAIRLTKVTIDVYEWAK